MNGMDMIKDIVRVYRKYPDYVAFVIDETSYTYKEVFARVRGIIPFVQNNPEDITGIIAEDCIETYASILAVLLAGKTYVILHPNYPDNRNRDIAEATGMKLVLYGHESDTLRGLPDGITCVSTLELRDEDATRPLGEQEYDENKNAYIIFTSGSTGVPERGSDQPEKPECILHGIPAIGLAIRANRPNVTNVRTDIRCFRRIYPIPVNYRGKCLHGRNRQVKVYESV